MQSAGLLRRKRLRVRRQGAQVVDDVSALLWISHADERHPGARRKGGRLGQPLVQISVCPFAVMLLQRVRERKALDLGDRSTNDAVQVRADAVAAALVEGVAGNAPLLLGVC